MGQDGAWPASDSGHTLEQNWSCPTSSQTLSEGGLRCEGCYQTECCTTHAHQGPELPTQKLGH